MAASVGRLQLEEARQKGSAEEDRNAGIPLRPLVEILREAKEKKEEDFQAQWRQMKQGGPGQSGCLSCITVPLWERLEGSKTCLSRGLPSMCNFSTGALLSFGIHFASCECKDDQCWMRFRLHGSNSTVDRGHRQKSAP